MAITPHPALPAGAATAIADRLASYRTDTCVIERPASGVDGTGAPVGGYTTVATVACQVRAPGRQPIESVGGGRFESAIDYEVLFGPAVDVRRHDRIQVNDRVLIVIADQDAVSHGFQVRALTKAVPV